MLQKNPISDALGQLQSSGLTFCVPANAQSLASSGDDSEEVTKYNQFQAFSEDSFGMRYQDDHLSSISSMWVSKIPGSRVMLEVM
jgi:hypothetical protein